MNIGVAVFTHNAKKHLPYFFPPILQSPLKPKILLVNSSSSDGTVELAKQFGVETLVIPRNHFNHGVTRELARKHLACDIVVMTTPDAYAKDSSVLEKLVNPIIEGEASLAYARQLPHKGASVFEAFPRYFNYPKCSHIRSKHDVKQFGVYTYFFSDSFGAYLNRALDEIGGFTACLTGEDTVACAKLLQADHKVAYVAEAEVYHSHDYTLLQEFKRHFDTGLARESYRQWIATGGDDSVRGKEYVKELFYYLSQNKQKHLIPYAFLQSLTKWIGYKLGQKCINAPLSLKQKLSSQDFYWKSVHK